MKVLAKPIEVVAAFNTQGEPTPIRFRIENKDKTLSVIRIDKLISRDIEKLAGNNMMVLKCQGIISGQERVFEIKYELRTCKWMLFKI